jgi:hypothetical protein
MKKILITSVIFSSILLGGVSVSAQSGGGGPGGGSGGGGPNIGVSLPNPLSGTGTIYQLIERIFNEIILPIGGVIAVMAFVYTGFLYVTAQGNTTKIATAHRALLYTSVGTAILLGAWVIATMIRTTIESLG